MLANNACRYSSRCVQALTGKHNSPGHQASDLERPEYMYTEYTPNIFNIFKSFNAWLAVDYAAYSMVS